MLDRTSGVSELQASIENLKKRIEDAKCVNDQLRGKIQVSLHEKGGSALSEAIQTLTKAQITARSQQEQLVAVQKKVAVKDDILLPLKAQKLEWAIEKNSERKTLLSILGIGMNVLEVGPEAAKIEFVVNSRLIITNYCCSEERFDCKFVTEMISAIQLNSFPPLLQ